MEYPPDSGYLGLARRYSAVTYRQTSLIKGWMLALARLRGPKSQSLDNLQIDWHQCQQACNADTWHNNKYTNILVQVPTKEVRCDFGLDIQ